MADLKPLIAELEAAKEGSRGLDAAVAVAAAIDLPSPMGEATAYLKLPHKDDCCELGTYWLVQRSGDSLQSALCYTTSLDAALPGENIRAVNHDHVSGNWMAAHVGEKATTWGIGKTEALARRIAALKALAKRPDDG